jgi:hypothetical protein
MRFLPLCLLFAACGDPLPPFEGAPLRVTAAVDAIELGRAFPLTVVRTWNKGEAPGEPDLAPLAVRLLDSTRREQGGRVQEVRRYTAHAFGDVRLPGLDLEVQRTLDPAAPGPVELPERAPARFPWEFALGAVAALALFLVLRARRTAPPPPPAAEPPAEAPPPAHERALERLAQLRQRIDADAEEFYGEATALLRDYVGERFDVGAEVLTGPELTAIAPGLGTPLAHCDLVRFAGHAPTVAERTRLLDDATAFVKETA